MIPANILSFLTVRNNQLNYWFIHTRTQYREKALKELQGKAKTKTKIRKGKVKRQTQKEQK